MLQKIDLLQPEPTPVQPDARQRRALRRLLRDVMHFIGSEPPKPLSSSKVKRRLLYRSARSLTDADLDRLVTEIGIERWWAAAERATSPTTTAAE